MRFRFSSSSMLVSNIKKCLMTAKKKCCGLFKKRVCVCGGQLRVQDMKPDGWYYVQIVKRAVLHFDTTGLNTLLKKGTLDHRSVTQSQLNFYAITSVLFTLSLCESGQFTEAVPNVKMPVTSSVMRTGQKWQTYQFCFFSGKCQSSWKALVFEHRSH